MEQSRESTDQKVQVKYDCADTSKYQCSFRPQWNNVKGGLAGGVGFSWLKRCDLVHGLHIISKDATMFGELNLFTTKTSQKEVWKVGRLRCW